MEAKEVINKILSEAKSQADEIIRQAEKELAEYNAASKQQADEFSQQSAQIAQNQAQDRKQRILASARMNSRKQILAAKQKVLGEVFADARRRLEAMEPAQYQELFAKLICAAVESGDETVVAGRRENILDAAFVEKINAQYKGKTPAKLKLADKKGDFDRGVILERGSVHVNISVDVLLQMARENLETSIAAELFAK